MEKNPITKGLPYVNNIGMIILIAIINIFCIFVFFFGREIKLYGIIQDSVICGITTSFIDVFIVFFLMNKMKAAGLFPTAVPVSPVMLRFPKQPFLLSICFSAIFSILMGGITYFFVYFFHITEFTFSGLLVWKILYSCVLAAKIQEFAVLRYVQLDTLSEYTHVSQNGNSSEVKNPLPHIGTFKEIFHTITDDFGFNLIIVMLTGGAIIQDECVIIYPIIRSSVFISGIILGIIVAIRMVYPVAVIIQNLARTGEIPVGARPKLWFLRVIPKSPKKVFAFFLLPVTFLSCICFYTVFEVFNFNTLNFFQFFVVRIIYITLLTKLLVHILVLRHSIGE